MLHLLQRAVSPLLRLKPCVQRWDDLSRFLREAPRRRALQIEDFTEPEATVS